jgi:hypothetical protein
MLLSRLVRAHRIQLVVLLIVALIVGATQCLASCAAEGSSSPAPPCHRQQTPHHAIAPACGQDFLIPDAHRLPTGHATVVAFLPPVSQATYELMLAEPFISPAFSPPERFPSTPSILRI